jgi:hypothetical protein
VLFLNDQGHGYGHLYFTSNGAWLHEQVSNSLSSLPLALSLL